MSEGTYVVRWGRYFYGDFFVPAWTFSLDSAMHLTEHQAGEVTLAFQKAGYKGLQILPAELVTALFLSQASS